MSASVWIDRWKTASIVMTVALIFPIFVAFAIAFLRPWGRLSRFTRVRAAALLALGLSLWCACAWIGWWLA